MSTRHYLDRSVYCALIKVKSQPQPVVVIERADTGNTVIVTIKTPDWIPIEVEVLARFKGDSNITTLMLGEVNTCCDLGVNAGDQWVVFLRRNPDGNLALTACSGSELFGDTLTRKGCEPRKTTIVDSLRMYAGQRYIASFMQRGHEQISHVPDRIKDTKMYDRNGQKGTAGNRVGGNLNGNYNAWTDKWQLLRKTQV
jgi:hypothetical protein